MPILLFKYTHTHDNGVRCYDLGSAYGSLEEKCTFRLQDKEYGMAYNTYTAGYYLFDTDTGEEVGHLRREVGRDLRAELQRLSVVAMLTPVKEGEC